MRASSEKRIQEGNEPDSTSTVKLKKPRATTPKKITFQPSKPDLLTEIGYSKPSLKLFCSILSNPLQAIEFLLGNSRMSVKRFFEEYWDKQPLLMTSRDLPTDFDNIFSYETFCKILKSTESEDSDRKLLFNEDVSFARYTEEGREDLDLNDGALTQSSFKQHLEREKFSLQFNQPQRYQDLLWSLMEKLESYFGCLVGAHAYITPKACQMSPPHLDVVQKFIVQTEGEKCWKLYAPKYPWGVDSAEEFTHDEIGEPILSVTLKQGDVLYIPRGYIHEAYAKTRSVHLTITTYLKHDVNKILQVQLPRLLERHTFKVPRLRSALPLHFLPKADRFCNKMFANALVELAESIRNDPKPLPVPEAMTVSFMTNRLPPYGLAEFEAEAHRQPRLEDSVMLRSKFHVAYFLRTTEDPPVDECDEDEVLIKSLRRRREDNEDEDRELVVMSSIRNRRFEHMMDPETINVSEGDVFSLAPDFLPVLEMLFQAEQPVPIGDLQIRNNKGHDIDVMILIRALFNVGALELS